MQWKRYAKDVCSETFIIVVSVLKRLSLYELTLWGRDLVSVVRTIREGPYYRVFFYRECMGILPEPL